MCYTRLEIILRKILISSYSSVFSFLENRLTPIYDFGYVAMNFGWVYPEDSGEYLCRATNLYGSDETRAIIKTAGKPGIIYDSQLPKGMKSIEKIREMEASWQTYDFFLFYLSGNNTTVIVLSILLY